MVFLDRHLFFWNQCKHLAVHNAIKEQDTCNYYVAVPERRRMSI
jgi:hypothetical protein